MPERHDFQIPIQSETALREFVELAFGITIPNTVVVPGHSTPWRAFCDSYFAQHRVTVWHASRGFGGKSYLLALLSLTEALTLKASVKLLGGSGAQSKNVQNYIGSELFDKPHAPTYLWDDEPTLTRSRFVWGNSIEALMASQRSVRGPHIPRLRLDEVDEMHLDIFQAALGQPMSVVSNGQVVIPAQITLSSTHHNADGTMTQVLRMAEERGWPVHRWDYQETSAEDGWLLPAEIAATRADIPATMWQVEYDLGEPSPEGRAIMPEKVAAAFREELGQYQGAVSEYIEIEAPARGGRYATGADWAKKKDFTVATTIRYDVTPWRVVAFERIRRRPWPAMIERFDRQVRRFASSAAHDATGVGGVVDDYLGVHAQGIEMVGRVRQKLFSDYVALIEGDGLVYPMIKWAHGEHKYCGVDDLYGRGHPPDSIVAGAMAVYAAQRGERRGARGT